MAVLIPSCRAFQDCWPATSACLAKFWPDCHWKIYTLSDRIPWGENPIVVPEDRGWSANLRFALEQIDAEFACMFLEDMLLVRDVNTAVVAGVYIVMEMNPNIGAIRLGQGGEQYEPENRIFSKIPSQSPYRISTSPTLWRVSYLKEILQHCNSTALEFEHDGTNYARNLPQEVWTMYGDDETKRPFRVYYTAITRGQWDRRAVEWLKRDVGVEVNTDRGFMPE